MDALNLADTMEQERQRLTKALESIMEKRIALDQEEKAIHIELSGIQAYLDAKMGRVVIRQKTGKVSAPRGPRKTGIRDRVLEVITADGVSKQDILAALDATEDKSMQQAISNALVALKKDNKVISGERGQYKLPTGDVPVIDSKPKRVKKEEAWSK